MGSQVPSATHVNKSQQEGKVPTFEPREPTRARFMLDPYYSMQKLSGLVLRVGSNLMLDLALNTSPKSHLQKVLPCRYSSHIWD